MFQDEARVGRINDVRRCWAPRPMRPLCQAMLTHEYTFAYASCEPATGTMDALILLQVNTQCVQLFLDTVAARHVSNPIVMVMDGAGWHSSKKLIAPSNIRLLALPPYAPELNPVEHLWHELREKCFHNKVFASIDDGITERWKGSFMCHSATAPRVHGLRRCNMVSFVAAVVCTGGVAQGGST